MECTPGKKLMLVALLFVLVTIRVRAEQNRENSNVSSLEKVDLAEGSNGGVYGGGGCGWGWGGPGGSSGGGGGGGGAGIWKCECKKQTVKRGKHQSAKLDFRRENHKMGEFAQCRARGRCSGMKLECPLHCGGPCLYDCTHACTAYCKR